MSDADAEVKVEICVVGAVAEKDFEIAVVVDSSDLKVVVVVEKSYPHVQVTVKVVVVGCGKAGLAEVEIVFLPCRKC